MSFALETLNLRGLQAVSLAMRASGQGRVQDTGSDEGAAAFSLLKGLKAMQEPHSPGSSRENV